MLTRTIRTTAVSRSFARTLPATAPLAVAARRPLSTTVPARNPPGRGGFPPPPPGNNGRGGAGGPIGNIFGGGAKREPGKVLEENSVDLTALAKEGKLDPVIGREQETRRMIEILSRRTKCVDPPPPRRHGQPPGPRAQG